MAVGASMPLRIATAALALFHSLGLPGELLEAEPKKRGEGLDVLVYGGATSTGTMAIQLLKLCGLRVITTCSPRNFELVRGYGADECVDYHSPTCGPDIRAMTGNKLDYALDCVTNEGTMKICYQALGRCGGNCRTSPFFPPLGVHPLSFCLSFSTPRSNPSVSVSSTNNKPSRRRSRTLSRHSRHPSSRPTRLDPRDMDARPTHQLAGAVRHRDG